MSAQLEIGLESRPLERVTADLVGVGYFSDDRPLRGGAGRLDWRLCGLLSERIAQGELTGKTGDCVLIPTCGALRTPRLLVRGLGKRSKYQVSNASTAIRDLATRALALGLNNLLISPPGVASDDFPRHAEAMLAGVIDAVRKADARLDLWLAITPSEIDRAQNALEEAVRASPHAALIANAPSARGPHAPLRTRSTPSRSPGGAAPAL